VDGLPIVGSNQLVAEGKIVCHQRRQYRIDKINATMIRRLDLADMARSRLSRKRRIAAQAVPQQTIARKSSTGTLSHACAIT